LSRDKFRVYVRGILSRLCEQANIYALKSSEEQEAMRHRALIVAYTTAHTESRVAAQKLSRGLLMRSGRIAVERRILVNAGEWDKDQRKPKPRNGILHRWARYPAKARFARALCGYSIGPDAVCLDTHMLRLTPDKRPRNAYQQWSKWFWVYRAQYGDDRAQWCIDWHHRLLDYIALVPDIYIGE
jgi:hypothetical protein